MTQWGLPVLREVIQTLHIGMATVQRVANGTTSLWQKEAPEQAGRIGTAAKFACYLTRQSEMIRENGIPVPSDPRNPIAALKVTTTVHYLYLDSPRLIAARKKKWRDTMQWIDEYRDSCPDDIAACTPQDYERFDRLLDRISGLTRPESPYAATSRACLHSPLSEVCLPFVCAKRRTIRAGVAGRNRPALKEKAKAREAAAALR
jgi:hypothetical protein